MKKHKNPAFMYYPKDWRADPVSVCSIAARGLWHEMMDLMHESPRYGYLCDQKGEPIPSDRMARACRVEAAEYELLLAELLAAGVPRLSSGNVIYSKRMVEDEQKRKEWRKSQKKHRDATHDVTRDVMRDVMPMSPVSAFAFPFSKEEQEQNKGAPAAPCPESPPPELPKLPVPVELWAQFVAHRQRLRAPMTPHAVDLIVRKLSVLHAQGYDPATLIETAIERGWKTVFEPKENGNGRTGGGTGFTDARKERARERSESDQQAIESVLGCRSGLVEHLRQGVPAGATEPGTSGGIQRGLDALVVKGGS